MPSDNWKINKIVQSYAGSVVASAQKWLPAPFAVGWAAAVEARGQNKTA